MGRRSLKKRRKSSMENTNRDQLSQTLLTSAEKIAGNEDLLSEILVRLPVRSLVRFKCVSKPWLHLISSSHFSLTHSTRNFRSLSASGFLFPTRFDFVGVDGSRRKFPPTLLTFMKKKSEVTVLHSCNGLMLCSTSLGEYYVCNPTTNKFLSIPPPPVSSYNFGFNLVFDPSRSSHFEIVYVNQVKPYKRGFMIPLTYGTNLYSSITQSWSFLDESPDRPFLPFYSNHDPLKNGVLCNGSLYWLSAYQWKLLRFEADKQRFSIITMNVDRNLMGINYHGHLWQCKGKLYLAKELNKINDPTDIAVYELGNVCSEWLVKYKVKFSDEVSGFDNVDGYGDEKVRTYTILAAIGGQEDDDMLLLIRLEYHFREPKVLLYNIKEKTATKMIFDGFEEEAQPFIESLSPVI